MTKRILIADDHISVLRAIKTALAAHADWEVCGDAADGQEAVDKATELHPDLVVLDLAMPRLDGLEAAKESTNGFRMFRSSCTRSTSQKRR